jgi:UDP-N-acetylglucosamine--dolichyl-phosphate N-acetylglucosaminephosphotransferase
MAMLGFADDVFDIKWRHKIYLPIFASIPLFVIYYISNGLTSVILPVPFRALFGRMVELGKRRIMQVDCSDIAVTC